MNGYQQFLEGKRVKAEPVGFAVADDAINAQLFPFQREIVRWALQRGRAALFADCGLGKTPMQLEWARNVAEHTGGNVLILAPLAVAAQTVREGSKFGVTVTHAREAHDVRPGINITNYERLEKFENLEWSGIVLDESSILKSFEGVMRKQITDLGSRIPFRLCCTATPAPNDLIELTNHAEFLSIMTGKEIIALFFKTDGNTTHSWRLKGHAKDAFWRWMASWSVAIRKPSDLGYADDAFVLPELRMHEHTTEAKAPAGMLFAVEALTLQDRQQARRDSLPDRVARTAALVNADNEPWIVWCNLNAESEALVRAIPGAVQVTGSDSAEWKEQAILDFSEGRSRVLVSKPTIAGYGVNWQHCASMAFVGLSDSYEQLYQAIRRCWRFGQRRPVNVHVITAENEGAVVRNIERKERQAADMFGEIVRHMAGLSLGRSEREEMVYEEADAHGAGWTLKLGDCVERVREVATDSVGLSVFSPPFPSMYAYTNSARDMGNVASIGQMITQFRFLMEELLRVTMPGRMCAIHLVQLTAMKSREGFIGLHDYRGKVIEQMTDCGWDYAGEVTIDKNPQIQATRNKERGLLFKSLATDSAMMRMALADYLIYFRKRGDNPAPIRAGVSERYDNPDGWISEEEWIEWAAPVWYRATKHYPGGIRETDVLNVRQARETNDERHLAPLQLGVIERAVKLWSAPGDLVLSPFAGIGSEGYVSVKLGRRFVGIELKRSYYESAIQNLKRAELEATAGQRDLFARLEAAV